MLTLDVTMPMDFWVWSSRVSSGVRVNPNYLYLVVVWRGIPFRVSLGGGRCEITLWPAPRYMTCVLLVFIESLLAKHHVLILFRSS